jgi:hypothetical protein
MFRRCQDSTDVYCEATCYNADDQLKQLQAFVAETDDAASAMWAMAQQSSFMLALLTSAIASKFDKDDYDRHVTGGSTYMIKCQRFWKWTIEHNLRSVFCGVAARGNIGSKT